MSLRNQGHFFLNETAIHISSALLISMCGTSSGKGKEDSMDGQV